MSNFDIGLISLPVLILLIFIRMPIGVAMIVCGLGGTALVFGDWTVVLAKMKSETYSTFSSHSLSIVPLFLLMGQFASLGGMSQSLFRAAEAFLGHRKGGVAMASVGASAGFGAICGSSLATAATMGQVALPELRRAGYEGGFATATLAAGGTLGILIPPSVVLVIYAILTEQNIAKLFMAAFIPGLLAAIGYMLTIAIYVRVFPGSEQIKSRMPYSERLTALLAVWPVLLVFFLVVGGIYFGWFTPTEAAAIGAAGTGLIALFSRSLTRDNFVDALLSTASNTAMIFLIVLGASYYNGFLALTQVPQEMSQYVVAMGLSPWVVLTVILLVYLVFGCIMDSLSMILLTIPIFFPIISGLDFGLSPEETALWFGILVLIVVEVGLITPPVGMNLFIINSMDKETRLGATYKAIMPFIASDILRTIILVMFPSLTLYLVRLFY
ncbi:TRAP transporter large permease [Ahrensia kielensis]|uniref:TRAP transporter large permease protein n=1 Tax=Ahrensia kielensis TaxID=76980 RepID=A0ABU9T4W9_9HYPH